jgi:hypothetical protein
MARDPYWIFAYWEMTDEALERARAEVKEPGAGCALRVYETTYRLFDGTNANWSVDLPVDRTTRSYYVRVNRPASTFHVDVGVMSSRGDFATIARSGAVETPRDGISADTRLEWMTVEADGDAGPEYRHRFVPRPGAAAPPGTVAPGELPAGGLDRVAAAFLGEAWTRAEWTETEMGGRVVRWFHWAGPTRAERWWSERAGPFTRVEILLGAEHRVVALERGAQVVVGPWEVRIFGLDGWGERRRLDRWTVHYAWVTGEGTERVDTSAIVARSLGGYRTRIVPAGSEVRLDRGVWSSEWRAEGASERRWLGAGEAELGGASELARLGASELRVLGASQLGWLGASEQRFLAASERLLGGASELGGGSEARLAESRPFSGGIEWLGGASPAARARSGEAP